MNDVKMCSGDMNTGISTSFFSVFRFILNLEKDIIKQNTYYVSGVYLFLFHDPVVLTHHLTDSDIYFLSPPSIHLFMMVVKPGCVCRWNSWPAVSLGDWQIALLLWQQFEDAHLRPTLFQYIDEETPSQKG